MQLETFPMGEGGGGGGSLMVFFLLSDPPGRPRPSLSAPNVWRVVPPPCSLLSSL